MYVGVLPKRMSKAQAAYLYLKYLLTGTVHVDYIAGNMPELAKEANFHHLAEQAASRAA